MAVSLLPSAFITLCLHVWHGYYTITILALASLFNPFIALVSASSVIGALCILLFDHTALLAFSPSDCLYATSNNGVVTGSHHALIEASFSSSATYIMFLLIFVRMYRVLLLLLYSNNGLDYYHVLQGHLTRCLGTPCIISACLHHYYHSYHLFMVYFFLFSIADTFKMIRADRLRRHFFSRVLMHFC